MGEKITITNITGLKSDDSDTYSVEITVTEYTVPKLENVVSVQPANTNKILNVAKAKVKIIDESTFKEDFIPAYFRIAYYDLEKSYHEIYVKLQ